MQLQANCLHWHWMHSRHMKKKLARTKMFLLLSMYHQKKTSKKLRKTEQAIRCFTYPDDVIVCLGLFMSSFRCGERTFVCHRRSLCNGRINDAIVGATIARTARRLYVQRSSIVHFVLAEQLCIECTGVAWISIVSMRRLTWTWSEYWIRLRKKRWTKIEKKCAWFVSGLENGEVIYDARWCCNWLMWENHSVSCLCRTGNRWTSFHLIFV